MKNRMFLLLALLIVIFAGCKVPVTPASVASVEVNPATSIVSKGTTQQFNAVVNGDNSSQKVTWSLMGALSSGSSIDATTGLLTIATDETADIVAVIATSDIDQAIAGSALVSTSQIASVTVEPNPAYAHINWTMQFSAVVNGSGNPPQAVNWIVTGGTSSNTNIDQNGLLTVASDETAPTLTVSATSWDATISGSTTVNVSVIGSFGPGGGRIFYDKGMYSNGWKYLEAAPESTEFLAPWGLYLTYCPGTKNDIGTGKANTKIIVDLLNKKGESGKAAQICDALVVNGIDDWFLPSKDELNEMYKGLKITNRDARDYWSSSVYYGDGYDKESEEVQGTVYTWLQRLTDGKQRIDDDGVGDLRHLEFTVRAIRAF